MISTMSDVLRVVLIAASVLLLFAMLRRIRKSKAKIEDAMFWVFFSLLLVVFALFPQTADFCASLVGTYSTPNFIYLLIIFLLLVKLFALSMRISQLETKVQNLVQRIAIDNNRIEEERKCADAKKGSE